MQTIKDKKSGLLFNVPNGDEQTVIQLAAIGLADYNLIQWCEQYLSSEGTFIDIGSGLGAFSLLLSLKCKSVWAFEADLSLISCLAVSATQNNRYNIRYNNVAVGKESGTATLYTTPTGATVRHELAKMITTGDITSIQDIKLVTVDSFALTNVDLMVVDADGSELDVVQGATLTLLDNNFPPLIIKLRQDEWYKDDKDLLFSHLRNLGYTIHPIGGCPNYYLASDHAMHKSSQQTKATKELQELEAHLQQTVVNYDKGQTENFTWYEWYLMARHYRNASKHQLCYDCAQRALLLDIPATKKYLVHEELSIACCYIDKKDEGYQAAENVITSKHAPFSTTNLAMKNQSFYMRALPLTDIVEVQHPVGDNYVTSSTAIISTATGYQLNVRAVNYELTAKGAYISRDSDGIIRTRNYLLDVDDKLSIVKAAELIDNTGVRRYLRLVEGLEDLRFFAPGEFTCTCLQTNEHCVPQICYGQFLEDGTVTKLLPLSIGGKLQCEKNWLPLYIKGVLHVVYTMAPFRLYSVDTTTGILTLVKEVDLLPALNIDFFRGSATLIPYREGWLVTIHQVYYDARRMYFHRFVWLNADFTEIKYSRAFFFESPNVEFNLSICHSSKGLLVPYSVNDNCSKVGILPYSVLDEMI